MTMSRRRFIWAAWNVFWWALLWGLLGLFMAWWGISNPFGYVFLGMFVGASVTARLRDHVSSGTRYALWVGFAFASFPVWLLVDLLMKAEAGPFLVALAASGCGAVIGICREVAYLLILRARAAIIRGEVA
jgi:hypothetical protein